MGVISRIVQDGYAYAAISIDCNETILQEPATHQAERRLAKQHFAHHLDATFQM